MAHHFRQGPCLVSRPASVLIYFPANMFDCSCPDLFQCYADVYGEEVIFNY